MADDPARSLARSAARLGRAAQNALEVARFGGLDTGEEPSPFDVVGRTPVYRLRRYFPEAGGEGRPALLLVPPLMLSAEVYDVSPRVSGVGALHEHGIDTWVVDFGAPEREEGGLRRTLADHVLAVSDAIDRVRHATGGDIHLGGYSQGGMFAYQVAAYRRGDGIRSLVTFGSPVDVHLLTPAGLPVAHLADAASALATTVLSRTSVPAALSRRVFQLIDPLKTARSRLSFVRQLHNRDALLEREGSRRFLEADGWVAWPGPAVAEFASQFIAHNRMLSGGFAIEDRMVSLADIDVPVLAVVGLTDEIAAAPAVRAVRRAVPRAEIWELAVAAGHMGLVVGSGARANTWPPVASWVHWQEGNGARPASITPLTEDHEEVAPGGIEVATELAIGAAQVVADTAIGAVRSVRSVFGEALDQLPRLARLQRIAPSTRVSLALLLAERSRRHPDDTFFLFEGRGYTYESALRRVDAIAHGLLAVGVRQGEHIGVLMGTRPTALALVAALSRVGAVAVMLRPDADVDREVALGHVTRIIADPDHAEEAAAVGGAEVLVLGTGGDRGRSVPPGTTDMERIDPASVTVPAWYEPDAGRARDLAVLLFTGHGEATQVNRITNHRFATSAFGTASAAALSGADTVYAVTPLQHASTLLTAVGGAVVSGARLAIGTTFTPDTFWEEVRRYGVSVVSYTWTMAADLVAAPPSVGERHHPIRLFVGSGMPVGLWERVLDRFRPAQVLEFYAHAEGDAVLANLDVGKVGAMGRSLPGTAEVAVVGWDHDEGRLLTGADGFVRRTEADEPGMLLARVRHDHTGFGARLLRGVFAPGDTWVSTGDLFVADADGDLWLLGGASSVIDAAGGPVHPRAVEAAIAADDSVDLCAVHAHRPPGQAHDLTVAVVTVREGRELTDEGLRQALSLIDGSSWPDVVRVVGLMPRSAHFRILHGVLAAEGVPADAVGLAWDGVAGRYRRLGPVGGEPAAATVTRTPGGSP